MSFLYAWALALSLLLAVPLLLHLRRRYTDRRVAFPALRYLTDARDARSRSLRASDLLLLALRIALLGLIAFIAAGPLLGRGGPADHEPTDVALLIDNSGSASRLVDDRPLLELLRERARHTLESAGPRDRFWVRPVVGPPLAAGVSAARAAAALARIEPTDGWADLSATVAEAAATLPVEAGRRREVQLLSDLQRTGLTEAPGEEMDGLPPVVAYAPPDVTAANAGVARLELTGGVTVPTGSGHGAVVRAERHGPVDGAGAPAEASLRLELDGALAGAALSPWGVPVTIGLPELPPGIHEGAVEIAPSGLRADDRRHFAIRVVDPPRVEREGPASSFLAVALATLRDAGRIGGGPSTVRVLEWPAPASAPAGSETLVLVPPRDPVELPAFNQLLDRLETGWTARVDPGRGEVRLGGDAALPLGDVGVRVRYLLRPVGEDAGADTTLLATEDGEPWLVRTRRASRTLLLLGSPLGPEASDLPASPLMIPFLEALLVRWSHLAAWPPGDFEAGAPVPLPAWADSVRRPDGTVERVEPGGLYRPLRSGVYRVSGRAPSGEASGERRAAFAVNVPERELDPAAAPLDSLSELLPGRAVITAGPDRADWDRAIYRARRGRDAAPWLLALVLLLGAGELFVATPGRAKRGRPGASARA